jgi:hypothetical protein
MNLHRASACRVLILSGLCFVGCTANRYEIELSPAAEGVERSLTCWRSDATDPQRIRTFPDTELQQIAAAYGVPVGDQVAEKQEFKGLFAEAMPNDVGGSGSYRRWETSLGSLSIYVERFRGNDDLLSELEQRLQAVDKVVDLLLGWLNETLADEDGFTQLRGFVNDSFRRDLKNLSLYGLSIELLPQQGDITQAVSESIIRAGHYFVERDYFSIEQLPEIIRASQEYEATGHSQRLLKIFQRLIATKMGVQQTARVPESLNFLGHEVALAKSLQSYLRGTDDYQRMLSAWEQAKAGDPDLKQPEPADVIGQPLMQAFLPRLFASSDALDVKLLAKRQPFMTNGQWDEQAGRLHWKRSMPTAEAKSFSFPTLLFALWCEPNNEFQQERFGKIIFDGEPLAQYCVWHRGLDDDEVEQWETFLSRPATQAQFVEQLRSFRFSHEPPADPADDGHDDLAAPVRDLIIAGMTDG